MYCEFADIFPSFIVKVVIVANFCFGYSWYVLASIFLKVILIFLFISPYVLIVEERSLSMIRQLVTAFVCNAERSSKKILSSMK